MKSVAAVLLFAATLVANASAQIARTPAQPCDALARVPLPNATITLASLVEPGTFRPAGLTTDDERAWAVRVFGTLPAFCRVAATLAPSSDSDIKVEVWLPATGWNGKFQGVGNGGFGGTIDHEDLAQAVTHGYAAAATDTGHASKSMTDAAWALKRPEKIIDFGYRAIHEMTVAGKALAHAYYGEAPRHAYFNSCSNGGRQALMSAQRYPEDYDGIIAGAPANDWTGLMAFGGLLAKTLGDPAGYIPPAKLPAIQAAALAACDLNDAVKDGVIDNPAACRFDTGALLCEGAESDACLTAPQLSALRVLHAGWQDESGRTPSAGFSPGAEAERGGWALWITGRRPESSLLFQFATHFFKYMVFDDASWDYRTFDVSRDPGVAAQTLSAILDAANPDLTAFRARGGKLILYHGWNDAAIPAAGTIDYYNRIVNHAGAEAASSFVRLYMLPGVQHCQGGPGPDLFAESVVPQRAASHDAGAALEAWVEQGIAPGAIVASKKTAALVRTRPVCPYPQVAVYNGSGSTDDAANFTCAAR